MDYECDLKPLDLPRKRISDAALRLDDLGRARVLFQLAPEAKNLDVDAAVEDVFMHPSGLQKVLPAERGCGASRKATSSAYSPLVNATFAPFGSVSLRARRLSCQPENR